MLQQDGEGGDDGGVVHVVVVDTWDKPCADELSEGDVEITVGGVDGASIDGDNGLDSLIGRTSSV
jgi:hypothetical protein